ncbi:hypothetical protein ACQY0O_003454 [Thecaphora frezii]
MYEERGHPARSWNNDAQRPFAAPDSVKAALHLEEARLTSEARIGPATLVRSNSNATDPRQNPADFDASLRPLELHDPGTAAAAVAAAPPFHQQAGADPVPAPASGGPVQGFHLGLSTVSSVGSAGAERNAGRSNLIIYADDRPGATAQQPPNPQIEAQRPKMNLVYQNEPYGVQDVGPGPERFKGPTVYPAGGMPAEDPGDNQVHFWPVPRLSQGYPGGVYPEANASEARISGVPDFLPVGMQGNEASGAAAPAGPSYIYSGSSPPLRHPIVYGQPNGFGGQPGTWSSSTTPTTEYPTAPYLAAHNRRLQPDEEFGQRYVHDAYSERDEDSGRSVSSQAAVMGISAAAGEAMTAGGFFDHTDAALWPLGPTQLAAVSRPLDYLEQGMGMPVHMMGSPDRNRPKPKIGTSVPPPKQFKCSACEAIFSRNHDLKRHARIHLAVKPFPCKFCDKAFSRKDALKRHVLVKGCGVGNKKNGDGRKRSKGGNNSNPNRAAKAEASSSHPLLEPGEASPDSSFDSQPYEVVQKPNDGGGAIQEDVRAFEHGAAGNAAWRPFLPNDRENPDATSYMGSEAAANGVRDLPYQGTQDRKVPWASAAPTHAAYLDANDDPGSSGLSHHRGEPLAGTGRAQVMSNSLAGAYPSDMAAPDPAPSRRAYGMPGPDVGYLHEADFARQAGRPGGSLPAGDDRGMAEPPTVPYDMAQVKQEPTVAQLHEGSFPSQGSVPPASNGGGGGGGVYGQSAPPSYRAHNPEGGNPPNFS